MPSNTALPDAAARAIMAEPESTPRGPVGDMGKAPYIRREVKDPLVPAVWLGNMRREVNDECAMQGFGMASQQVAAGPCPTAQVVGNAFVHQYYHILHQSPDLVYRFYQDSSKLGRPDAQEAMSSITTMQDMTIRLPSETRPTVGQHEVADADPDLCTWDGPSSVENPDPG
ncbi:hypothetical protein EJ110_NYTH10204 [Nymphaea thermarum]|nr:hypothetical protein EJ110_NYTH10204 [Nymphaea thermarum]